jgi:MFS family permease
MKDLFGMTDTQSGTLFSSMFISIILGLNSVSYLSVRVGRRTVVTMGFILNSLGILLLSSAKSYYVAAFAIAVSGFGIGLLSLSIYSLMGEIVPKSRGSLVGLTSGLYGLGGFVGPFLTGIMISQFNWQLPLYVFGAISLVAAVFFVFLSRHPLVQKRGDVENMKLHIEGLNSRKILLASISMLAADFGFVAFVSWTPSFLLKIRGLDMVQTGTIVGIWALMGGMGAITLGWLSDRHDRRLVIFASGIFTSVLALFYYFYASTPMLILIVSVILGFTSSAFWNLNISLAQDSVAPSAIVSVTARAQTFAYVGAVCAPVVTSELSKLVGLTTGLIACVSIPYFIHSALILLIEKQRG